ncbi:unnamed protein product, partial [Ranitomeya imitator]
ASCGDFLQKSGEYGSLQSRAVDEKTSWGLDKMKKRRTTPETTSSIRYLDYMDNDDSRIRGTLCPSLIGRGNLYDIIVAMATIMTSMSILCPSLNQKHSSVGASFMSQSLVAIIGQFIPFGGVPRDGRSNFPATPEPPSQGFSGSIQWTRCMKNGRSADGWVSATEKIPTNFCMMIKCNDDQPQRSLQYGGDPQRVP